HVIGAAQDPARDRARGELPLELVEHTEVADALAWLGAVGRLRDELLERGAVERGEDRRDAPPLFGHGVGRWRRRWIQKEQASRALQDAREQVAVADVDQSDLSASALPFVGALVGMQDDRHELPVFEE